MWLSEQNVPNLHNYKYLEIPIWNIQLNISREGKEVLTHLSLQIHSYTMSFSWPILQSSQFDGQSFWPVVWWFPTWWVLVQSHHHHLKTTQALKHIIQAQETSPRKSRSVNHWQSYTHGLLIHWCSNWVVVKSVPCHLVQIRLVLANLVTYNHGHKGLHDLYYCIKPVKPTRLHWISSQVFDFLSHTIYHDTEVSGLS